MLQRFNTHQIICGVDEAGRGCIAGPGGGSSYYFTKRFYTYFFLNDSSNYQVQRNELRPIIEKNAIAFGVGIIDNIKIDEVNILQTTYLAMHKTMSK